MWLTTVPYTPGPPPQNRKRSPSLLHLHLSIPPQVNTSLTIFSAIFATPSPLRIPLHPTINSYLVNSQTTATTQQQRCPHSRATQHAHPASTCGFNQNCGKMENCQHTHQRCVRFSWKHARSHVWASTGHKCSIVGAIWWGQFSRWGMVGWGWGPSQWYMASLGLTRWQGHYFLRNWACS